MMWSEKNNAHLGMNVASDIQILIWPAIAAYFAATLVVQFPFV